MIEQRISDETLSAMAEAAEVNDGLTFIGLDDGAKAVLDLRDARAEIPRLAASYEARLADAYQAAGALIHAMGLSDNADCIRLQDVLAYGKTEDGVDLLPWPRDPEALARDSDVVRLTAERDALRSRPMSGDVACSARSLKILRDMYASDDTFLGAVAEMVNQDVGEADVRAEHAASRYDALAKQNEMLKAENKRLEGFVSTLKEERDQWCAQAIIEHDALLAERAGVSESMVERARAKHLEILIRQNGEEGVDDSDLPPEEEAEDLAYWKEVLEAALATPIPTPVDRDAIRAEACDHDFVEMPNGYGLDVCCKCGMRGATIRSGAKTEALR